jgi:hypothetical protein
MFLKRAARPGLERLYANGLASQRSRIMGHHFFMTASCSVKSMRLLHANDGVHQRECRLAAKTSIRSRRCFSTSEICHIRFPPMRFVTSDKFPLQPVFCATKVLSASNAPTNALKNARIRRPFRGNATMICGGRPRQKAAFIVHSSATI